MKLNPDCIRDLLLAIEDVTEPGCFWAYNEEDVQPSLRKYSPSEIEYHLSQAEMSDLIILNGCSDGVSMVEDLTPNGHEFLANIRENTVWNGVKEVSGKIGSTSLSTLTTISSNVITELIKSYFLLSH